MAATYLEIYAALAADTRALLHRLCWLAPQPIPRFLFKGGENQQELRELETAGLLHWNAENTVFSLDTLLQTLPRYEYPPNGPTPESLTEALTWIDQATPDPQDVRIWDRWTSLAPHIIAITRHGIERNIPEPTARLLNQLGLYECARAEYMVAEPHYRKALEITERTYGAESPVVASVLNNLAQSLQATNRLGEAEPLMRRALAIDEASFGDSHPKVAIRLNNFAQLLQATNRLGEAEPLMRRALVIDEASYGNSHPDVAIRLSNLAQLLQTTNRLDEAEPLIRRALAIDKARYGDSHPNVARDFNNLAQLLQATNRLDEAEPLMRRHLEIFLQFTRDTGHQHPHLKDSINHYANLLMKIGDTQAKAVEKIRAVMAPFGMSI